MNENSDIDNSTDERTVAMNGLSIVSTTNCIAASRLHTINFFTGLEAPLAASFGQDHYEKSR